MRPQAPVYTLVSSDSFDSQDGLLAKAEKQVDLEPRWAVRRSNCVVYLLAATCGALLLCVAVLAAAYLSLSDAKKAESLDSKRRPLQRSSHCSPTSYDGGRWVRKANYMSQLHSEQDVLRAGGFEVCKMTLDGTHPLGLDELEPPFTTLVEPLSYEWQPHPTCEMGDQLSIVEKLQLLIDHPVLFVGDSRIKHHYFSLTCELGEHTEWAGDFRLSHLTLSPNSSLLPQLRLPAGFDFSTPLASLLVRYLPLNQTEVLELARTDPALTGVNATIDPERLWDYQFQSFDYFTLILSSLTPRYDVLLFSIGAHLSPQIFPRIKSQSDMIALERSIVQKVLRGVSAILRPDQRVFTQAAAALQSEPVGYDMPLIEVGDPGQHFNAAYLHELNDVLEAETLFMQDERFQWLGMERLTRLRPDAHLKWNDDAHYIVGSGVYKARTRYLLHRMQQQYW